MMSLFSLPQFGGGVEWGSKRKGLALVWSW